MFPLPNHGEGDVGLRKCWYVVHTQPRREGVALENLRRQGFDSWLPMAVRRVRRGGRWCSKIEPLFTRYLFVNLNFGSEDVSPIRSTIGCVGLVRSGNAPSAVPEGVVEALRAAADPETGLHQVDALQIPRFREGDPVVVLEGPFAGLGGIFQGASGEERARVLLRMLGGVASLKLSQHALGSPSEQSRL